jgi:hypothetical protein
MINGINQRKEIIMPNLVKKVDYFNKEYNNNDSIALYEWEYPHKWYVVEPSVTNCRKYNYNGVRTFNLLSDAEKYFEHLVNITSKSGVVDRAV